MSETYEKQCNECAFWNQFENCAENDGECRRYPPKVFLTDPTDSGEGTFSFCPDVNGEEKVCGEFRNKR